MNDEGRNLEYKCQVSRDEKFERSVVAFLNSREGGTIFVGIEDDGTVCGVANPDLVQRQVADRIRNRDPSDHPRHAPSRAPSDHPRHHPSHAPSHHPSRYAFEVIGRRVGRRHFTI